MLKIFEIDVIQVKITYNSYDYYDTECCIFVLKEELEQCGGLEACAKLTDKK